MRTLFRPVVGLPIVLFAACNTVAPKLPQDGGEQRDARAVAPDARAVDSGSQLDVAFDAGTDAAVDVDANAPTDASVNDAATDGGADMDAAAADGGAVDASTADASVLSDIVVTYPSAAPIAPATECMVTTAAQLSCSGAHVANCSALDLVTAPPACGPHYGSWAAFSVYDAPVPWGFLMHSMEHGAVVLAYACNESTCPTVPTALAEFVAGYADDPECAENAASKRLIVVPDETLDVPIAAAAWGQIYRATCFDLPSLSAFVDANYAHSPENECADGIDLSSTGWCVEDASSSP